MPKRKIYRKVYRKSGKKAGLLLTLKISGIGCLLAILMVFLVFIFYAKDLPRPEIFAERHFTESTKIYDRTGSVLLYEIHGEEKRTIVPLEKFPEHLKQAVTVVEDSNFYNHFGIDFGGIARSVLINLKIGKPIYGGSTIPQQLIRSTFLSPEKTIERKMKEIILAIELDRRYPKDQILEWYLNQIPLGQNAYGMESASQIYFSKPVSEISVAEAAILASLIQAPYRLSPYGDYKENLLTRKDYILKRMYEEGYLETEEDYLKAKEEIINFSAPKGIKAPHFVLYIIEKYLKPKYGQDLEYLKENGVKIYTSLDWQFQEIAEKAVKEGTEKNKIYNAHNAALVAIDPKNGNILAMAGSANWFADPYPEDCIPGKNCLFDPQFNIATGTKESPGRQPGSAFKPFIYAAAFEAGYDDKTEVTDLPSNFGVWGGKEYTPQNYDGSFRGWVSLRQSLAQSLNIPSIKTLFLAGSEEKIEKLETNDFSGMENIFLAGLRKSIDLAKKMGITTLEKPLSSYGPAIVLGGGEVNLLNLVSGYSVFASKGMLSSPVSILKIEDYNGNILEETKTVPKRILSEKTAKMINDILSDNEARAPMFGYSSHLYFDEYQVAAKTGTTDNFRDVWTVGYTPSIAVGVWSGNSNNAPMTKKQPAATVAGPIFNNFLMGVLSNLPKESF
jgi:membrane peptidoglycan carboxypeptidase